MRITHQRQQEQLRIVTPRSVHVQIGLRSRNARTKKQNMSQRNLTVVLARSAPKPHAAFVVWSSAQPQGATPPPPANLQHYTVIVNLPDVKAGYMK